MPQTVGGLWNWRYSLRGFPCQTTSLGTDRLGPRWAIRVNRIGEPLRTTFGTPSKKAGRDYAIFGFVCPSTTQRCGPGCRLADL